jgi:hypothetical protein
MHELESELVHVDIHVVRPTARHDFWFLFTTGMSTRPMKKPHDAPGECLAEVSLLLPPEWRLDRASLRDPRWFWPLRELREAALLPHRFASWLADGHTIIPQDVTAAFDVSRSLDASTRLASLLVLATELLPSIITARKHRIELLTLHPMYPEELDYKIEHGLDALLRAFNDAGVGDVIDPARESAIPASSTEAARS